MGLGLQSGLGLRLRAEGQVRVIARAGGDKIPRSANKAALLLQLATVLVLEMRNKEDSDDGCSRPQPQG